MRRTTMHSSKLVFVIKNRFLGKSCLTSGICSVVTDIEELLQPIWRRKKTSVSSIFTTHMHVLFFIKLFSSQLLMTLMYFI